MNKKTVADIDVKGKRALVRVDFNVPLADGKVSDDARIRAALPTIRALLDRGSVVILMSHLGRPDGKVVEKLRLAPVGEVLSTLLGRPVRTLSDCTGPEVEASCREAKPGDVLLLENLRFHPEEEKNDPSFAGALASLGDIFVNDAFGTAHRAHASTEGVTRYLPSVAGFLMQKEMEALGKALESPERPFAAVLGGAKVSDKIGVIRNLLGKVDVLMIGGGMAFTFLKAKGYEIGTSLLDEKHLEEVKGILAASGKVGIHLPLDVVITQEVTKNTQFQVVDAGAMLPGWKGVDIGPRTCVAFEQVLGRAKTIVWNGPMGVFEIPEFAKGTETVARAIAESSSTSIVGGGESAQAVEQLGLSPKITHVSTGGGASLEFLEGRVLPGVAALLDKTSAPVAP
ncbi:MAG: phosphoglycerate kinase [Armatimonadetes bacterium]|nr:phosphoglycerate kinase [Armatimonadota bacterium]